MSGRVGTLGTPEEVSVDPGRETCLGRRDQRVGRLRSVKKTELKPKDRRVKSHWWYKTKLRTTQIHQPFNTIRLSTH